MREGMWGKAVLGARRSSFPVPRSELAFPPRSAGRGLALTALWQELTLPAMLPPRALRLAAASL